MVCAKQYFSLNVAPKCTQRVTEKKKITTTHQHASFFPPFSLDRSSKFTIIYYQADKNRLQAQEAQQTNANFGGRLNSVFLLLRPPFPLLQIIPQVISRSVSLRLEEKRCENTHTHTCTAGTPLRLCTGKSSGSECGEGAAWENTLVCVCV